MRRPAAGSVVVPVADLEERAVPVAARLVDLAEAVPAGRAVVVQVVPAAGG